MKKRVLLFMLMGLLLVPFVSAEILIGQPESLYSVGDQLDIAIDVSPSAESSDFFLAKIMCSSDEVEIYRVPLSLSSEDIKSIDISVKLDRFLIDDMEGDCFIRATYKDDVSESQKFELSNDVKVNIEIANSLVNPGDTLELVGNAIKKNGDALNGYIEVEISEVNWTFSDVVTDGKFEFNISLDSDMPGESYELNVRAYEKDNNDEVTNEGEASTLFKVRKVPSSLKISASYSEVKPGEDWSYTVFLYDQADREIADDVSIVLYRPDGSVFNKKVAESGELNYFESEKDYTPGYWKIEAEAVGFIVDKQFYVQELEELKYVLENETLIILNVGNVPYVNPVEVSIGDVTEVKQLNLEVGESERIRLYAPNGEYGIKVGDSENREHLGTTYLTGRAISVGGFELENYIVVVWLVLILLIVAMAVYIYRKSMKRKMLEKEQMGYVDKTDSKEDKAMSTAGVASSIESGNKEENSVVALKIKNLEDLKKLRSGAIDEINDVLIKAKKKGAKIYVDGTQRIIIFSKMVTKNKGNELNAVSLGKEIEDTLRGYNKIHPEKVDFGIGVNVGDMIVEHKEGKLRFVSLKKTLSNSKKLAEEAKNEMLISEETHRRVIGNMKCEKVKEGSWRVKRITNRARYSDFVSGFVNRQRTAKN